MLYDEGNECVEITGGWNEKAGVTSGITKLEKSIYFNYETSSNNFIEIGTSREINTENFSTLFAYVSNLSTARYGRIYTINSSGVYSSYEYFSSGTFVSHSLNGQSFKVRYTCGVGPNKSYTYLYDIFMVKDDNWQKLIDEAGLTTTTYTTLDSVFSNSSAINTILSNEEAVDFMAKQCTGTVMSSAIQDTNFLNALKTSPYKSIIEENTHWAKFLNMVEYFD